MIRERLPGFLDDAASDRLVQIKVLLERDLNLTREDIEWLIKEIEEKDNVIFELRQEKDSNKAKLLLD